MSNYIEDFIGRKIVPYRIEIQHLQLPKDPNLVKTIDTIIEANFRQLLDRKEGIVVPEQNAKELAMTRAYVLTARLARDLGILLFSASLGNFRMGEDYAELYSEIMSIFGADKEQIKLQKLKEYAEEITGDMLIRIALGTRQ